MSDEPKAKQSQTPMHIHFIGDANLPLDTLQRLQSQGYTFSYRVDEQPDIIFGPRCYNYSGEIDEKTFNLVTKSTRARIRAEKKATKEAEKLAKQQAKAEKQLTLNLEDECV